MPRKANENKIWQQQIEAILQSAGEGICVIDGNGVVSFANESAAKMLGGAAHDFVGRRYDEVFFGKKYLPAELAVSPIQFALTEGETAHVNSDTFSRRDGKAFWVEYICAPLKNEEKISGAVVTFQDITERRDLEAALAEARDAALEAARVKAAFLANMSHEIRTPLNGIIGAADLLLTTDLSPPQSEYARILSSSAGLLLDLVGDILDFSKIEAGRLRLEIREFDLRAILTETLEFFQRAAAKKDLRLKTEIAGNVGVKFRGDGGRLRQILNNLVGNAVKFTERGEVCLTISESADEEGDPVLRFEISDTGIGISAAELKKLFQPFAQADVSTTRRFGGTGLGLAISKQLVEMMGGEIGAESESGRGSTFWFTVRLARNQDAEILKRAGAKNENSPAHGFGAQNPKILVAEDNEVSRLVLSEMLRQLGFAVETAANGAEAVELWQTENFEIVFMDCQMPEMDGYAAAQKIRQLENGLPQTIIAALTGRVAEGEREKCLRSGMDDYLPKPVSRERLINFLIQQTRHKNILKSLDLPADLSQHLSAYIEKEKLDNFLQIESRGNENFVFEMLNLYLKHAESLSEELETAMASRDENSALQAAHSLKGSSGSAGLKKLSGLFADLEKDIEAKNWTAARIRIRDVSAEHEEIKELVSKLNV